MFKVAVRYNLIFIVWTMQVVHGTKCIQCKTNLTDEESFTAHLGQHGCSSLPAPCVICRQTLNTETEVMLHARLHLGLESNHAALGQHVSLLHANSAFTVAKVRLYTISVLPDQPNKSFFLLLLHTTLADPAL